MPLGAGWLASWACMGQTVSHRLQHEVCLGLNWCPSGQWAASCPGHHHESVVDPWHSWAMAAAKLWAKPKDLVSTYAVPVVLGPAARRSRLPAQLTQPGPCRLEVPELPQQHHMRPQLPVQPLVFSYHHSGLMQLP